MFLKNRTFFILFVKMAAKTCFLFKVRGAVAVSFLAGSDSLLNTVGERYFTGIHIFAADMEEKHLQTTQLPSIAGIISLLMDIKIMFLFIFY